MSKKGTKMAPKEVPSYELRDIVLGKVRGFPPWPGMIVDPESVPPIVQEERPSKKAKFYCVRFFPAGDFAWLVSKDISKLQTHEIESYINEPYKKSGDLLSGYRIALDPTKWEAERLSNITFEHTAEEDAAEIDELESDGAIAKKSKSKKRKRESDVTPAKARKPTKPKKESSEATKKRSPPKGRKNGSKSQAIVESEDEADGEAEGEQEEDAGPSKKVSPPPSKKLRRDKEDDEDSKLGEDSEALKVREWRHRLQKAFLGKIVPDPMDMPNYHSLFQTVESYDKINIQYLQFSKIGKVMRHITALSDDKVPRDDEFRFRERARALVDQWHQVLNANKDKMTTASSINPAMNGTDANGTKTEKDEAAVVEGAAAIDLNGGGAGNDADEDADGVGETSMLGDVTMSEA